MMTARLHQFVQESRTTLRYDGVGVLLWKWLIAAFAPVCRVGVEHVFCYDLTQPLQPRPARVPLHIRLATPDDVDDLIAMEHGRPQPDDGSLDDEAEYREDQRARTRSHFTHQYHREMGMGEKCYVAMVDGDIAHMSWTRFDRATPITGLTFLLAPGEEVFASDAFTCEKYRGKSVHGEVNMHMLQQAKASGHRKAYIMTDLVKTASRRGLYRVGWQRVGILLYVIPRGLGRTFVVRLWGSLGPLTRTARTP